MRLRGRQWMKIRAAYLQEYPLCIMCELKGIVTAAKEIDHIIPLFKGGKDGWDNYQALCVECHKQKTAEDLNQATGCDLSGFPPKWQD
jgi:5-methylcytosine-specific restriction protein A